MRARFLCAFGVGVLQGFSACSAAESVPPEVDEAELATTDHELKKGAGGVNCDGNYCDGSVLCALGEGDCDLTSQCDQATAAGPLVCVQNNGAKWGCSSGTDMCAPAHCTNRRLDAGETQVDCGGPCGPICPAPCAGLPASGSAGHCTTQCPCNFKDGDCNVNSECAPNGVCLQNRGDLFGFAAGVDVCVAAHCTNAVLDGGETGLDCGGPDCAPCPSSIVNAVRFGGPQFDYAQAVGLDASRNLYVLFRYASSSFDIGLGDVGNAGSSDMLLAKFSPRGVPLWNRRLGNAAADGDFNVALAVDADGNAYAVANFYGALNLGGGDLIGAGATDNIDFYVAKFDPGGNHVWSRSFGGIGLDRLRRLAIDPAGDVLLVGFFKEAITFGTTTLDSQGNYDAFVAKLSGANGGDMWCRSWGAAADDRAYGIATDAASNIYVSGQIGGTIDFGLGSVTTSNSSIDAFLVKLTSGGNTLAATTFGGTTRGDMATTVGVDNQQRPVIGGSFTSNIDFGSGVFDPALSDVFLIGYNSDFSRRWARHVGGPGYDYIGDLVVKATGEMAVAGYFSNSIDLGSGSIAAAGTRDMFLVRLTNAGVVSWSDTFGGAGSTQPMSLLLDNSTLYVSGYFEQTVPFGSFTLGPAGGRDGFLTQFAF